MEMHKVDAVFVGIGTSLLPFPGMDPQAPKQSQSGLWEDVSAMYHVLQLLSSVRKPKLGKERAQFGPTDAEDGPE